MLDRWIRLKLDLFLDLFDEIRHFYDVGLILGLRVSTVMLHNSIFGCMY